MNTLRMMVWLGIFWALTPITAWAQFTDDFTDGDFTNAPTWQGDATHFQVNTLQQLWLNAPAVTATSHLTTSSNAISNATFQFEVQLDFDPSTSNYARVYLASNSSNLLASLTGYFVQIGGASGTVDDVSLYYQSGTNVTKIIDGIDGTVATSPHAVVQVTRSAMGTWELLLDTALNGSFVSQGTVTHMLSTTSQFFGVFCKYTSTRSDKFFFDNFTVTGGPTTDTTPPVVTSVTPLNNTQITVTFNEAVEAISAQNTLHYSVNSGIGNPTNAVISSNNEEVVLTFGALQANTPYTLSVDQISDLAGNTLTLQTVNFMISGGTTHFGDVVINEIFADPTPSVGLPEAEFIELYNSTNAPINLQGWVYADASSSVVLPNYILGSQDYVVLCKATDTTLFQPFGAVIGLSSWPSLNNAGDQLGLRNNQMLLIDSVNYTDSWYQDGAKSAGGWTLERINPTAPCSDQTNWIAALLPPGGTPGTQNSAFNNTPNITALQVAEVTVLSQNALTIQFNAAVDTTNITANQFVVSPTTAIANIQVNSLTQIDLTLASNLDSATIYQLLVSGITNCYGQPMADTSVAIAIGITPMAGDLIINEIYASPSAENLYLPEAEFVEIYNPTNVPVRLSAGTFSDRTTAAFIPLTVILPGDYLILCEQKFASNFAPFGNVLGLSSWPSLNNSGDLLTLSEGNQTLDQVAYLSSWYSNPTKITGYSLELKNPQEKCLGPNNWDGCVAENQGTPGRQNSIYTTQFSIDFEWVSAQITQPAEIVLTFTQNCDTQNISPTHFELLPSIPISQITFHPELPNQITLTLAHDLENEVEYALHVTQIKNCVQLPLQGDDQKLIRLPNTQDLLINEVLFNPRTGGSDFIELYNTTATDINLKGWNLLYFSNGDSAFKPVTMVDFIVPSHTLVVLTEDSANIQYEYPNNGTGKYLETDLPTYSNASGRVILQNQLGTLCDAFSYTEEMHLEIISNPKGVSLERVNYALGPNTANNFNSAAANVNYASPAQVNSQFTDVHLKNQKITVAPQTFSPNNDGYQDVTLISYQFPEPNWIATVTIHNANGQLVRTLVNNKTLGTQNGIVWNGQNDLGEILPSGIYMVIFRVFDLQGNQHVFKAAAVLAQP